MEKMQRTRRVVNCRIYYQLHFKHSWQSELPFCTCLRMQGIYVCMYVRVQKGSPTAGYILGKRSRPPVSHIIKIERGARRHLIPILAASSGRQKRRRGDGGRGALAGHTQSRQSTDKAYSGQQFSGGIHQYAKHVLLSSNGKCFIFTYDRPETETETELKP